MIQSYRTNTAQHIETTDGFDKSATTSLITGRYIMYVYYDISCYICICTHILFCEKNALKAEEYKPILCTDCLMITKQINFHSYKNLLNPTV